MQDDQQYIDRILDSGSEQALLALVKKYERKVFNLAFRIVRIREEAEEIAQDAFLKSFKGLSKLEDQSKYGGWLMRIVYHAAIDWTRKKKMEMISADQSIALQLEDDASIGTIERLAGLERSELIEKLLQQLPEIESAIISLYYLDGLSVKEIAEVTALTDSNVKIKLMRTREVLKKQLERAFGSETENLY